MADISESTLIAPPPDFEFDYDHNEVHFKGRTIRLSPHEADIFRILLDNRARTTSMNTLIQRVYGHAEPENAAVSIRVAITSLRKKIDETGIKIKSEPRIGYEIDAQAVPDLNRRLSDKILVALNTAKGIGEREIAERLQTVYEFAETRRRRWLQTRPAAI